MCGRFARYSSLDAIKRFFRVAGDLPAALGPSYNIAPTHAVLAMIDRGGRRLGLLRWGLVPAWAGDTAGASRLINARAETLRSKPSFRYLLENRRCAIIADGFYEWTSGPGRRQPWYLTLPAGDLCAFAGLWDVWTGEDGRTYVSCTIITTAASRQVSGIHQRMPLVLRPDALDAWLDGEVRDVEALERILREGHVEEFRLRPVSHYVNNPAHNDARCLDAAGLP
jgi:putative SOS response-associated peptidase YedK